MVKLSAIVATARDDYSMLGLPNTHIFEPMVNSLKTQTFKDFELIIVDSLYKYRSKLFRRNKFQGKKLPFPVKHLPPKSSPYMEKGMWHVCNNLNTGIIHVDGELLIHFGDCAELLDTGTLQKFWNWYKKGYFVSALVTYFHKGKPIHYNEAYRKLFSLTKEGYTHLTYKEIVEYLDRIYKENQVVRDSRWSFVQTTPNGVLFNAKIDAWWYGYTSVSLDAALKINGFNELFDGNKSLEDCDFGTRLKLAGYNNFVLDSKLTVIEHWHGSISKKAVWYRGRTWKSNYILMELSKKRCRFRANSERLSEEDIEFIRSKSVGWDGVTAEDVENPMFDWWVTQQPILDLRELRLEV